MTVGPMKLLRAFLGGFTIVFSGSVSTMALFRTAGIDCGYFKGTAAWLLAVIVTYSVREAVSVMEAAG